MFQKTTQRISDFFSRQSERGAEIWLFIISFAESSFFPIPPDFFLMPLTLKRPEKWWKYALNTTSASVLGALFGYMIGSLLFNTLGKWFIDLYNLGDYVIKVGELFKENEFLAIFSAAFTPIPYKVFTIAGGLFHINIPILIISSIVGRGGRFFAVAYLTKVFGKIIGEEVVFKYFNIFTWFIAIVVLIFLSISLM